MPSFSVRWRTRRHVLCARGSFFLSCRRQLATSTLSGGWTFVVSVGSPISQALLISLAVTSDFHVYDRISMTNLVSEHGPLEATRTRLMNLGPIIMSYSNVKSKIRSAGS